MKINYRYQQVNKTCKNQIEDYFDDKKLKRITVLLHPRDLELALLDVRVEYFSHHNDFLVKMFLTAGKLEFESEKRAFNIIEAFDISLDRLISQLRKAESMRHNK